MGYCKYYELSYHLFKSVGKIMFDDDENDEDIYVPRKHKKKVTKKATKKAAKKATKKVAKKATKKVAR